MAIMQLSLLMEPQVLGKPIRNSWLFHNINRMLGTEDKPGIMFQTLKELFDKIKGYQIDRFYNIRVSFLEIYNEQIRDLIMVSSDVLDLREDPIKGVCVAGLSEIEVDTPEEILDLLM